MALELPDLPYAYDALGPYMSKETLEFHHDKHHMAYVTNGNNLLCPADGAISQIGAIENGRIFQAKGQHYTCAELLGDEDFANTFSNGSFATIYLSPRDYHRVHMPIDGKLVAGLDREELARDGLKEVLRKKINILYHISKFV